MKIVANEKQIKQKSLIGQIASFASLAILGVGFYLSLTSRDPEMLGFMWAALLLGFLLSQFGLYYGNRWSRRPDKALDQALKGLDDRYAIYHYTSAATHVLVGPAGLWVLQPYHQMGKIVYEKNRWKQKGGSFLQKYLRLFGQENIGRPDLEIESELDSMRKYLQKKMPDAELPPVQAALVFMHEKAEIAAEEAPIPTLLAKDLKDYLRKTTKGKALTPEKAKLIQDVLGS